VVRTIVNGTASLLDSASRLQDLRRIVNISSASIYGNQPEEITRIPEKFYSGPDINLAMSAYAEGKRMSEVLCSIYRTQYRMEIVTIRPFAFIGPYQSLDRPWAINNFLSDALNKGPIRILGDGSTVRSYMYPSDMVNWVLNILLRGKNGFVYNMGSTEEIKLMQLAQKIASFFSDKIDIQSNIAPVSNKISRLIPDTSLAEKDLQLRLTVSLDEALFRSIEWFKEDRRINS
jgi:dTDP-glucose 4,6-dehydratase